MKEEQKNDHVYLPFPAVDYFQRQDHSRGLHFRYRPAHEKKIIRRLGLYAVYAVTLVAEIVKANLAVMKVILTKAEYHPAIVRIKVPLEENFSRVLLSNSITLTPGTVTVEQSGEEYLVLCLDKESAYDIPDWNLVRLLKKMEEK